MPFEFKRNRKIHSRVFKISEWYLEKVMAYDLMQRLFTL